MKDVRTFASMILAELSGRMNKKNKSMSNAKSPREMVTLEGLTKKPVEAAKSSTLKAVENSAAGKSIITLKDIEKMQNVQVIAIKKGDILTPSAKDYLKKKNIKLEVK